MTDFLIGCGGWAYFQVNGITPLEAYSSAYDFVEINSTFYEIPNIELVKKWRKTVPKNFEFAVRCNQKLTHDLHFENIEESYQIYNKMKSICDILQSKFLVFGTPKSFQFTEKRIDKIINFFESIEQSNFHFVWEIRRHEKQEIPSRIINFLTEKEIIHSVDLTKEEPKTNHEIIYSRLFGKGWHNVYQFTNKELVQLANKIEKLDPKIIAISFHNSKMYKDSARYKVFKHTGIFPQVTKGISEESIREILLEDAKFPYSKKELVKDQGWKVIELSNNRNVHASDLFEKLPDKEYNDVNDILTLIQF
ncbi:MAG: DUF72 domain-containing protein [Candidatus Ranarchaeia archaeon]